MIDCSRSTLLDDGSVQAETNSATLRAMQEAREGIGIPLEEVVAWVESWDTDNELPAPVARKLY